MLSDRHPNSIWRTCRHISLARASPRRRTLAANTCILRHHSVHTSWLGTPSFRPLPARPPTGGRAGDVQGTAGKSLRSDGRPAATLIHFRATPTHLPTVCNTNINTNTNCDDAEMPNSFALERQERNLTVGGLRIRRANAATDREFVRHPPDSSACAAPAMQLRGLASNRGSSRGCDLALWVERRHRLSGATLHVAWGDPGQRA